MLFLEDLINSPTTGPNRLRLSLLFDRKMQQIDCTSCLMAPDLYSDSTYANVFAGSSLRALLPKWPLLLHLDIGLFILVAQHRQQVSLYAVLMILWSYDTSLTFSFHFMLSFLVFFCFWHLPLFFSFSFWSRSIFGSVKSFLAINTACS